MRIDLARKLAPPSPAECVLSAEIVFRMEQLRELGPENEKARGDDATGRVAF
jgi:hypothetical protein